MEDYKRVTLSAADAANYLGISYWLITQLVKRGELPCARVGGKLLFRRNSLDEFLTQKENATLGKEALITLK